MTAQKLSSKPVSGISPDILRRAFVDSLVKLNPRNMARNPVMFVVWVGTLLAIELTCWPTAFGPSRSGAAYNGALMIILFEGGLTTKPSVLRE